MADKPTYGELERRVQELEKIESELEYAREMLGVYEKVSLGYPSLDEKGHFHQTHCISHDITHRKHAEENLKKLEWMLSDKALSTAAGRTEAYDPGCYGDLTELNRDGIVLQSIGREQLYSIANDYLELLGTSSAIYEVNGDYAFGVFSSGWCRMLDRASRKLCNTPDNLEALASGRWLCHESCWTDCSQKVIAGCTPMDIACNGGIRLYGVPIIASGKVVGVINFGYGDPPNDPEKLQKIADTYHVEYDTLVREAYAYDSRPPFIVELAKKRLHTSARIIGSMIETKQAEEALRESEEKHRRLFETMAQGVIYQDADGRIISANPAAERILGLTFDQMRGKTSMDPRWKMINQDGTGVPGTEHPAMVALRTGETTGPVNRGVFHPDKNAYVWLSITAIPLFRPGETLPFQAYSTFEDVTERKKAIEELKEREAFIKATLDNLPVGVAVNSVDPKVHFTYMNDNFPTHYRTTREALAEPNDFWEVVYTDAAFREEIRKRVLEDCASNAPERMYWEDVPVSRSGKKPFYITAKNIPLPENNLMVSTVWDVTARKQAEEEREKLQKQLAQAQKMESVGRLAGGVAHDFNNKLAIINGYAEIALETIAPSDPLHETIREIHTAGKQSADIVRQLLAFARQQTISPVLLDLNDTISSMLKMLQRLIGENIDLQWHPGSNLAPVKMDPSQVDQIMANLAVNSRDAISDTGKLTIETDNIGVDENYCRTNPDAIPGQYVMLAVSDDGCGIEEEIKGQLFDPYFTTKDVGKGTGLGLPTIYGIVKQNNGFVNVYSEPGGGTTFKLYFPSSETGKSSAYAGKASTGPIPTGTETILVVEDEKTILQMSKQMLERLGYTVETAGSPSEALQISEEYEGAVHLLITDVIMPDMNGRDLSVRLSKNHPGLKTLYMSGYTANVIAHHGVIDEGVQFIQKPFSVRDLAVKVREVIDQG